MLDNGVASLNIPGFYVGAFHFVIFYH